MATSDPYIGRREAIGLGIESVPGTTVVPQCWLRWLSHGLQPKTNVIENESAMGVIDRVNDSAVSAKWVEGSIGGKVTSEAIGFLLLGHFGQVSTGAAVAGIYPHTFSQKQSSKPTTLSVAHVTPLASQRYGYGTLDNLELTAEAGGWVEMSTAAKARVGEISTETVAFVDEVEFTSEHITVKVAANVAGLAGAPVAVVSRVSLTSERSSEAFNPLGTVDKPQFDRGAYEARGEFVVRLTDTQYEEDYLSNALKALRITLANGTTSLEFTAPRARYRELENSRDLDGIVTATVQFFCEFDPSTNSSLIPVLKNSRPAYAAV